jgi:hypothetical protein
MGESAAFQIALIHTCPVVFSSVVIPKIIFLDKESNNCLQARVSVFVNHSMLFIFF